MSLDNTTPKELDCALNYFIVFIERNYEAVQNGHEALPSFYWCCLN